MGSGRFDKKGQTAAARQEDTGSHVFYFKWIQVFSGAISHRNPMLKARICVRLCWVITAVLGLSLGSVSGGLLLLVVRGLLTSESFSCCGTWAQLPCGMWDSPRSGIEPTSPALAGGFLSTAAPGKFKKFN